MYTELTDDILDQVIGENEITIVQYSAGWCGNCRLLKPTFKRLGDENREANFVLVDAEKLPKSRQLANVTNLPTFAAFKKGEFLGQVQTNKSDKLKSFIDEVTGN